MVKLPMLVLEEIVPSSYNPSLAEPVELPPR
jgi:hypothetical protein